MKYLLILSLAIFCIGCSQNAPITVEKMVISPDTVVFPAGDSVAAVSITHTCTCPFSWNATISPATDWLVLDTNFQSYQSGDKDDVPVSINRWLLTSDTSRTFIHIVSNAYGGDSILVIAYK
jgi:hypothetical protein